MNTFPETLQEAIQYFAVPWQAHQFMVEMGGFLAIPINGSGFWGLGHDLNGSPVA